MFMYSHKSTWAKNLSHKPSVTTDTLTIQWMTDTEWPVSVSYIFEDTNSFFFRPKMCLNRERIIMTLIMREFSFLIIQKFSLWQIPDSKLCQRTCLKRWSQFIQYKDVLILSFHTICLNPYNDCTWFYSKIW